jgi:hypothetical protein
VYNDACILEAGFLQDTRRGIQLGERLSSNGTDTVALGQFDKERSHPGGDPPSFLIREGEIGDLHTSFIGGALTAQVPTSSPSSAAR